MTSQTIFRAEHHSNYTVISNETLRDKRLKPNTLFVLTNVIGLPTDWDLTDRGLAKFLEVGKDLVNKAIKQLVELGYATREAIRNSRGQIVEWRTQIFERPNLDRESIVSRSHFTRSGIARSGEAGHIQSKDQTNYVSEKVNITPPISSKTQEEEKPKIKAFGGIKSNSQLLATFGAMLKPLFNGITDLVDQLSAPPPVPKPKVNPSDRSVDTQASAATASVLRKLSEITGEGVESLRTNLGLQKTLERYSHNLEGVLQYLELDCKGIKVGVGLVVMALREGRKATKAGGTTWKEWADQAFAANLMSYSTSEGNDILIVLRNGKCLLWSEAQKLTWEQVRAIAGEDAF